MTDEAPRSQMEGGQVRADVSGDHYALRRARLAVILIGVVFVVWAIVLIFRTSFIATDGRRYFSLFDDAMISMRYAWNASHGIGLVWNPGERVEGYTNLLMVLLMGLWTSLLDKSLAVLAVQLTGIPVLLGIGALTALHWRELAKSRDVSHDRELAVIAFLGALAYYPLAYWTLMGMETGLLTLLLLGGSLLSVTYMRVKRPALLVLAALIFSVAYLARPDTAPVALVVLGWAGLATRRPEGSRLWVVAGCLAVYALLPAVQVAFRASYYGSLVPLTYILKATGMPLAARLQNGLGFTLPFLYEVRLLTFIAGVGLLVTFSMRKVILALPPLILISYQIGIGGDAWPYWRLVAPGIPYLVLLVLASLDWGSAALPRALRATTRWITTHRGGGAPGGVSFHVPRPLLRFGLLLLGTGLICAGVFADRLHPGWPGFGMSQLLLVVLGCLACLVGVAMPWVSGASATGLAVLLPLLIIINGRFLREAFFIDSPYKAEPNRDHVNAALSILRYTTEDATVGVIQAGIIPYYTSRYAIDFLGKNDPYIANLPVNLQGGPGWYGMSSVPGHNKYDLIYSIIVRKPTYVEGFAWGSQDLNAVFEESYVEISLPGPDPAFRRGDPSVRWDLILPGDILDSAQD